MSHRLWETCYLGLIYVCDVGVLHSKAPFIDNVIGVQARRSNDTEDTEPASFRSGDAGWVSGSSPECHRPTHLGHGQWHGSIRKGPVRRANSADIPCARDQDQETHLLLRMSFIGWKLPFRRWKRHPMQPILHLTHNNYSDNNNITHTYMVKIWVNATCA